MGNSITLFRLFGIPFRINYTWLIILGLVITSLALYQFPASYPGWPSFEYWLIAAVTTFFFFSSVVLHELSHSLMALRHGLPVKSITLFIFGGVAHIGREAERPRTEALIALAGPISSLLIAGAFTLLAYFGGFLSQQVKAMATWLAIINVSLAAFNLVPGLPLDGGRVLRAILWNLTKSYRKSTRVATFSGRVVAYSMVGGGVAIMMLGWWASGIWLIFIGLFLDNAAVANYRQSVRRESLSRYEAADLMMPLSDNVAPSAGLPAVDASASATSVMEAMEEAGLQEVLVLREGRIVGVVTRKAFNALKGA